MAAASTTFEDEAEFANLADYDSDSEETQPAAADNKKAKEDHHIALHSAGFKDFLLKPELIRAIADCGYEHPSEVQHECIPAAVLGGDVICQAKSGMGKTAVFVLSVLHQLDPNPSPGSVLVLSPARELAHQICDEFTRFIKYMPGIKAAEFYGGVPVTENQQLLHDEPPHIIVGTPGRILQLARSKSLVLSKVKHFILDECDQMLDSVGIKKYALFW